MMNFRNLLTLSLIPTVIFTLLSLLSILLTATYWIISDYFVGRWLKRPSQFPEKNKFQWDDVVVSYTETSTNAIITAGCLCLAAGVNCTLVQDTSSRCKPQAMSEFFWHDTRITCVHRCFSFLETVHITNVYPQF